jgi:hypothetical protein
MLEGYQRADARFIDYELYELPGVAGTFRGPPIRGREYIACVGAAQTFGRFVEAPYPRLLSHALGIETLNLGRGGAGPTFPLSSPGLTEYINRARMVIVQFFSGRSQSNSLFRIARHGMRGINLGDGSESSADDFYRWLLGQEEQTARRIVAETRENYVASMTRLLKAIKPPKILLWFSVREPAYQEQWQLPLQRLWGEFPQLVNQPMVDQLRGHCDAYVECVSRRGLPQPLPERPGGVAGLADALSAQDITKPENRYYPSPEMHEDAATLLTPVCRDLLAERRG